MALAEEPIARIELWPEGAPGGWKVEGPESRRRDDGKVLHVSNVATPRIERFGGDAPPDAPLALVVPGGGYWIVAVEHEGEEVARRLEANEIEAWVLTYRLPREGAEPRWRVPVEDVLRACEILRELGRPLAGVGFSAGGHAVAIAAAEDALDRVALVYPAYLTPEERHDRVADEVAPTHAVPTFLAITEDDPCGAGRARTYMDAVRRTGALTEEHYPPTGGHGYGLLPHGEDAPWLPRLYAFLRGEGTIA